MINFKQQEVKRSEDLRFTTGQGRYTGDLAPENLAHLIFVRSPHAHAKIVSIDTQAAREAEGVLAVITAEDLFAAGLKEAAGGIGFKRPDGSPAPTDSRPSLVRNRVRHMGEAVVAIVAHTALQAADAAELVQIDYEPLPVVHA
ncbi:MAG: xanthine dehydrogenase family protein molybdopterin-binding subunit, partial [Methylocystaceae bacterium]|nr:xanthine dehydrogenase family protein molybdopterin-binding subunit [Methylocystaceae bacterium]